MEFELLANLFIPEATTLSASISNPESVSSKIAKSGFNKLICKKTIPRIRNNTSFNR